MKIYKVKYIFIFNLRKLVPPKGQFLFQFIILTLQKKKKISQARGKMSPKSNSRGALGQNDFL